MLTKKIINNIFKIDGFIQKPEAQFLYSLTNKLKNGVIVELGSFKGRSTVAIGLAALKNNSKVYAVDTFKGDSSTGKQDTLISFKKNINKFKLTRVVNPVVGTTNRVGKSWKTAIDFLFIDALHTYKAVKDDFLIWEKHLKENGIIAFHDSLLPNPPRAVFEDYVLKSRRYKIVGFSESIIAVRKVNKELNEFEVFINYFKYYLRDLKHLSYKYSWPIRKTASLLGLYHEKEY